MTQQFDWQRIAADLDQYGCALVRGVLAPADCAALVAAYSQLELFRSRVIMQRYGFGKGEYQYFRYPLPDLVQQLRSSLYPPLAEIANRWYAAMDLAPRFPATHEEFIARCHAAEQQRPTPLLLQYGAGDYNCLHQDLYGEHVFPLQAAFLLSQPGQDFEGGEFILTEQRPRAQSRAHVPPLQKGDAVAFAVNERPVDGARGPVRAVMRHGVSTIRSGNRMALGLIFHGAA